MDMLSGVLIVLLAVSLSGCALFNASAKPGYTSGEMFALTYYATEDVQSDRVQEARAAAKVAYEALRYVVMDGQELDESLVQMVMAKMDDSNPAVRLLAYKMATAAMQDLKAKFPVVTPAVLKNFFEGIDATVKNYAAIK